MNIMISTWSLQVGGGEILAMNLAAQLTANGNKVFLFNQRAHLVDKDLVQRLLPSSVRVLSMFDRPIRNFLANKINAIQKRLTGEGKYYDNQQRAYLKKCIERYKIDVISSHATYSDAICAPVVQQTHTPFVITEHGEYTIFMLNGQYTFSSILKQATSIITVSNYCQQQLRRSFAELPPMQTIYDGVITDLSHQKINVREALNIGQNDFVFGMAARGVALKGWEQAITAFIQLRDSYLLRSIHFVLVGGSAYIDKLKKQFGDEIGLHFIGRVPNPDFYMAGFDVGLLPTYFPSEALSLSIIEYMTYGLPTIATCLGGIPELLAQPEKEAGQLINIDPQTEKPNVHELRSAMFRYMTDESFYAQHAKQALALSKSFTMSACAEQYENVFQAAISQA